MQTVHCPVCGSDDVTKNSEQKSLTVPFGPTVNYSNIDFTCKSCGESGDFSYETDRNISQAIAESQRVSVDSMISQVSSSGITMSYIERALDLPQRTITRWKATGCSSGSLALLRIVRTYPWILGVAERGFDEGFAKRTLVTQAMGLIGDAVAAGTVGGVHTKIRVSGTQDAVHIDARMSISSKSGSGNIRVPAPLQTVQALIDSVNVKVAVGT